jgi:hypothetical protein
VLRFYRNQIIRVSFTPCLGRLTLVKVYER